MLSTLTVEDTSVFVAGQTLISELPISCTLLACALVWRNLIAFGRNLIIWVALVLGLACIRFRDIQQLVANILLALSDSDFSEVMFRRTPAPM